MALATFYFYDNFERVLSSDKLSHFFHPSEIRLGDILKATIKGFGLGFSFKLKKKDDEF